MRDTEASLLRRKRSARTTWLGNPSRKRRNVNRNLMSRYKEIGGVRESKGRVCRRRKECRRRKDARHVK